MNISEIDYITNLVLAIIDLDDDIELSVNYADLIIQRDSLLTVWDSITIPDMSDTQYETLSLLIAYMDERNEIIDTLILKRNNIQNLFRI